MVGISPLISSNYFRSPKPEGTTIVRSSSIAFEDQSQPASTTTYFLLVPLESLNGIAEI